MKIRWFDGFQYHMNAVGHPGHQYKRTTFYKSIILNLFIRFFFMCFSLLSLLLLFVLLPTLHPSLHEIPLLHLSDSFPSPPTFCLCLFPCLYRPLPSSSLFASSSDESRASSTLSVPSSPGALSGPVEPLDISVTGAALETPKGYYCFLFITSMLLYI